MEKLHILAIAAHPDDIELGCAGTLIKHIKKGQKAGILDLTEGELGSRGTVADRYEEAAEAARIMGVHVRENLQLADGFFENNKESQLKLIRYIRRFQPDIVLANALADRHPDHGKGARLIADACFLSGLRKIETTWNGETQAAWRPKRVFHFMQDRHIEPTFLVDISEEIDTKIAAVLAYKSQFYNPDSQEPVTYIATEEFVHQIRFRDSIFGKRLGVKYAESFVCENVVGVSDLDSLVYPGIS